MTRIPQSNTRVTSARLTSTPTAPQEPPHAQFQRRALVMLSRLAIVAAFLALWQFAIRGQNVVFFSHPTLVVQRLYQLLTEGLFWHDVWTTAIEIIIGYAIGATIGLAIGALFGRSQFASDIFQPFVFVMYSIPKIAIAPIFIVAFGLGLTSKVLIVALSAFFLVFVNTFSGIRSLNEEFVNLARIMDASRLQVLRYIVLPAAAPHILVGLRTAVPYAVVGAIIGEFIGSNQGLGFFILNAAQVFNATSMIAGIIILVVIVLLANQALTMLDARVLKWQPKRAESRVQV